jgi:Cytochrome P460/Putative zinc-finger
MSCVFSREMLALHVEGDLSGRAAEMTSSHLETCEDCRRFLEELRARQSLLKSLRRETVSPSECTRMRREVMSIINHGQDRSGWALQVERAIMLGFRRRSYALAAFALLAIVSVSVLAQMRHTAPTTQQAAAVFEGGDTLFRPEGYRDWIMVGPSATAHRSGVNHGAASTTGTAIPSVYIDPSGYREYAKTGSFPEGTVMVWESVSREPETADRPHKESPVLLASVKDSTRFDGGWGFFDFTGLEGSTTSKAQASESSGCRACHRRDAETDQVFTQFYPVLQSARRAAQLAVPRWSASLTAVLAVPHPSRFPGPPPMAHT